MEKKRIKLEAEKAIEVETRTFNAVALEWLNMQQDSWAASNYKKKKRLVDILSLNIGERPIAHIIPADILSV